MDTKTFERNVTLGFKLFAGYYGGSITKDSIGDLPRVGRAIPWGTLQFETLINEVGYELAAIDVFRYWKSWNLSLIEATSDAVAINFLLMLTKDWARKSGPARGSGAHDAFIRNAVTLFDRSIFEYVSGAWGGSGDSRIASNLASIDGLPPVWPGVATDRWQALLEEVVDHGELRGRNYTGKLDSRPVLLLYYRNVIRDMMGPNDRSKRVHVDHVIPQKLFDSEPDPDSLANKHHICNLALLPADENVQKSGSRLSDLGSPWVKDQVSKYADIPVERFADFSVPSQSAALRAFRAPILKADLDERRARLVSDPQGRR